MYSGAGDSLQQGVSPAVQIGDTIFVNNTAPNAFVVSVAADGTVQIASGGNTSRQSFNFKLYRRITGLFDPTIGTVWINEVAPTWGAGFSVSVPSFTVMTTINLAGAPYAQSSEGDTLVFSLASGALPSGIALSSSGIISGFPTVPGTYNFTVSAADITGMATASPAMKIVVLIGSVVGLSLLPALAALAALPSGPVSIVYVYNTGVAKDIVIAQQGIGIGVAVTLYVSNGPSIAQIVK